MAKKPRVDRLPTIEEIDSDEDLVLDVEFYKETTLYWNGKQFVLGIPKKLERLLKIKKGDKFAFDVKIDPSDSRRDELKFKIRRKKSAKKKKSDN